MNARKLQKRSIYFLSIQSVQHSSTGVIAILFKHIQLAAGVWWCDSQKKFAIKKLPFGSFLNYRLNQFPVGAGAGASPPAGATGAIGTSIGGMPGIAIGMVAPCE